MQIYKALKKQTVSRM